MTSHSVLYVSMSKIIRALILSAAATGVAALVVTKIQQSKVSNPSKETRRDPFEVDAETLPESEVNRLTDELGAML